MKRTSVTVLQNRSNYMVTVPDPENLSNEHGIEIEGLLDYMDPQETSASTTSAEKINAGGPSDTQLHGGV